MIESVVALVLLSLLVAGPLGWREWRDRGEAKALAVRADIHAALTRTLGGESLVAVRVLPPTPWRAGQVILSTPSGCEALIRTGWQAVMAKLPHDYDLVVRSAERASPPPVGITLAWGQVA